MKKDRCRRVAIALAVAIVAVLAACAPGPLEGGPGKRIYAQVAWDETLNRLMIVEGQVGPNVAQVDSWALDPAGRTWTEISGLGRPLPTVSLAWHRGQAKLVAFVSTRWRAMGAKNDLDNVSETWTFDPAANEWKRLETIGTPTPGLLGCRIAYDSRTSRIVLFGGMDAMGGGYKDETWILDLFARTWTRANPAVSPPSRNYFQMAYDETAGLTLAIGRDTREYDLSTWAYDSAADAWTRLDLPELPEPRVYADMVYVPELGGCLLFGGVTMPGEKPRADTWLFTMAAGWTKIETVHEPSARGWHALAWDPVGKRAWLYGGGSRRSMPTNELWYWDLKTRDWVQVERAPAP